MVAKKESGSHFYSDVYAVVRKIPKGKVTTYGTIAVILGKPRAARAVGYALNALKKGQEQTVPWQRVINAKGQISFKGDVIRASFQKKILKKEGIKFLPDEETIDLKKYGWFQ
ncbi:MGMT family protein [Leptospira idonii]|uniref:Cysteine methyltransferase n=1 Tax=Leptospira idonii TaxID=1193500 RepID=A0A4V3JY76_9LEPT|nr:MGMT family protein [Leptospira idonii]TGN19416.1 cysteine methyltransferase [Leptospira idonii]